MQETFDDQRLWDDDRMKANTIRTSVPPGIHPVICTTPLATTLDRAA
jgi:hypothetical protein